jgi:hypothetical protein
MNGRQDNLFFKCVPRDGILISAEDNPTATGRDEELQLAVLGAAVAFEPRSLSRSSMKI